MWKATATLDQNAMTAAKQVKSDGADEEWDSGNALIS
jgi:hypothetical protein